MKKKEIYIVLVIALIAVAGIFVLKNPFVKKGSGVTVVIQRGDQIVQRFDPMVDAIYHVEGAYGTLDVEVKDQKWRVVNEVCPNHICASMGWVGVDEVIPITCLPNQVIIYVEEQ